MQKMECKPLVSLLKEALKNVGKSAINVPFISRHPSHSLLLTSYYTEQTADNI